MAAEFSTRKLRLSRVSPPGQLKNVTIEPRIFSTFRGKLDPMIARQAWALLDIQ